MIATIAIALWSHLFCGPWSESGKVFGWLKAWASDSLPHVIRHPFIECSACHSVWITMIYQVATYSGHYDFGSVIQVLCASYGAILLEDFKEIREKWKYN